MYILVVTIVSAEEANLRARINAEQHGGSESLRLTYHRIGAYISRVSSHLEIELSYSSQE